MVWTHYFGGILGLKGILGLRVQNYMANLIDYLTW